MNEERLEELLAEFWSRRDSGELLTPSAFLREHAEHQDALRPALQDLLGTAAMLPTGDLPTAIGGYLVEGRLGRGAAGEVFAVVDGDGRPLALKRLLPHIAAVVRAQQRLQREAAVLRELHHPNIVEVIDVGDEGGAPFVVMERIDGTSLQAIVAAAREGDPERAFAALAGPGNRWQRSARCMAALARALAAAHGRGVLHRDLKPGNVLVRRDGTPVLVDFGLAADADAATLTGTGDVLGTPHYMSPEQARGLAADASSDVYGLGAVLHALLTLSPPRHGQDPLQVLVEARSALPPTPRSVARDVPRKLDLITRRAMAFRKHQRFASAAEFGEALQLVADGGRPIGLTLGFATRVDEFYRRRRTPLVSALAAMVIAAVVWIGIDLRNASLVERLRQAVIAAVECHLDGDKDGVAKAAAVMADGSERALAAWLQHGDEVATDDPFVSKLAEGHRIMAADAKAAVSAFQRAVELRPDASVGSAWLGVAAIRAKVYDVAERELTSAVRVLPGSVRLRIEFARVLQQQKKFDAAVLQMQQAVTLSRADAGTWHELARRLGNAKRHAEALTAIDKAIALLGREPDEGMLRTKAVSLDELGRHAEAVPLLQRIVEVAPSAGAWNSYGRALDYLHRLDEAAAAYRTALTYDSKHARSIMNLVHLHAGSDRGKCAGCRAFFEQHPEMADPKLVDRYATEMLVAQEGEFTEAEVVARYVRAVGGDELFTAALEERLKKDLPAEPLGRLLRARKVLRGE